MKLKILHLLLVVDKKINESPVQLRGFFGTEFSEYPIFHHHLETNGKKKHIYEYPKIQYKVNKNMAIVLGIGDEAIATLKKIILNVKEIRLGINIYKLIKIKIHYEEPEFGILNDNTFYTYKFIAPWFALNQKNYEIYKNASIEEARNLLKKILVANLISVSKYLDYTVSNQIKANVELFPINILFKNEKMIGFNGKFEINFLIPNYLGIGKSVSQGFGTIKRIK